MNLADLQLLETGLLHADPHPGNLLRTADGKICILDFGLMTEVAPERRIALVEGNLGFTPEGTPLVPCIGCGSKLSCTAPAQGAALPVSLQDARQHLNESLSYLAELGGKGRAVKDIPILCTS